MRDRTQAATSAAGRRSILPGGTVLVALALAGAASAEPAPSEARPAAEKPVYTVKEQSAIGAATLFLNGFPVGAEAYGELAVLQAGENQRYWTFYDPDEVHKIDATALSHVVDKTASTPKAGARDDELFSPEDAAFYEMLIYANRTSPAALDKAALRDNNGDLWAQVFRNPVKYRGELVHFDGRLKRVRRYDATPMAVQGGVENYYEAFLFADVQQNDPVVMVFTELPAGMKTGDQDTPVGFTGYFFKIYRYTAVDTKKTEKDRLAPMVVGRTVAPQAAPAAAAEADPTGGEWPTWLGPLFFGVVGLTVALLFLLGYWFRHGDNRVHGRIFAARYGEFTEPGPDAPPDPREEAKQADPPRNRLNEGPPA